MSSKFGQSLNNGDGVNPDIKSNEKDDWDMFNEKEEFQEHEVDVTQVEEDDTNLNHRIDGIDFNKLADEILYSDLETENNEATKKHNYEQTGKTNYFNEEEIIDVEVYSEDDTPKENSSPQEEVQTEPDIPEEPKRNIFSNLKQKFAKKEEPVEEYNPQDPENEFLKELEENKQTTHKAGLPKKILQVSVISLVSLSVAYIGYAMVLKPTLNTVKLRNQATSNVPQNNETIEDLLQQTNPEDIVVDSLQQVLDKAQSTIQSTNGLDWLEEKEDWVITGEASSSNSDQKSTYLNSDYNIEFQYPASWVETYDFRTLDTKDNVHNIVMLGNSAGNVVLNNMRIVVEDTKQSLTSKQYVEKTEELMRNTFPEFQSIDTGEITVAGRGALTRMYLWVPDSEKARTPYPQEWTRIQQYQIYVSGQAKMYIITFTATREDFSKFYNTYESILNTLTFGI